MTEKTIAHLETLRANARDEVKRRIEQRDKYSVQLSIALTALVGISFSITGFRMILIAVPLVSIYFTVLILYSYKIHSTLASYLREKIELKMAEYYEIEKDYEWENYYKTQHVPGIRRIFFMVALWVVTILSIVFLWCTEQNQQLTVVQVLGILYAISNILITVFFWKS
jgi:Na+/melibiose symporter-like transporter